MQDVSEGTFAQTTLISTPATEGHAFSDLRAHLPDIHASETAGEQTCTLPHSFEGFPHCYDQALHLEGYHGSGALRGHWVALSDSNATLARKLRQKYLQRQEKALREACCWSCGYCPYETVSQHQKIVHHMREVYVVFLSKSFLELNSYAMCFMTLRRILAI